MSEITGWEWKPVLVDKCNHGEKEEEYCQKKRPHVKFEHQKIYKMQLR